MYRIGNRRQKSISWEVQKTQKKNNNNKNIYTKYAWDLNNLLDILENIRLGPKMSYNAFKNKYKYKYLILTHFFSSPPLK